MVSRRAKNPANKRRFGALSRNLEVSPPSSLSSRRQQARSFGRGPPRTSLSSWSTVDNVIHSHMVSPARERQSRTACVEAVCEDHNDALNEVRMVPTTETLGEHAEANAVRWIGEFLKRPSSRWTRRALETTPVDQSVVLALPLRAGRPQGAGSLCARICTSRFGLGAGMRGRKPATRELASRRSQRRLRREASLVAVPPLCLSRSARFGDNTFAPSACSPPWRSEWSTVLRRPFFRYGLLSAPAIRQRRSPSGDDVVARIESRETPAKISGWRFS